MGTLGWVGRCKVAVRWDINAAISLPRFRLRLGVSPTAAVRCGPVIGDYSFDAMVILG